MTNAGDHSLLEEMLFDGRRRAQLRKRVIQRLDEQLVALAQATDSDIKQIEQNVQVLNLLITILPLSSNRDYSQFAAVQKKLVTVKAALTARTGAPWKPFSLRNAEIPKVTQSINSLIGEG